jgi:hypothetical protein
MTKPMALVVFITKMVIAMKENGSTIKLMEKGYSFVILASLVTMVNGKMINKTVWEQNYGMTELVMMENIKKE